MSDSHPLPSALMEGLFKRFVDGLPVDTGDCFNNRLYWHIFIYYHGGVGRNKGLSGNTEISVVIHGRIKRYYLCFAYTSLYH